MSSKAKTQSAKAVGKVASVPKLRFPEFRGAGEWTTETLGSVARISTEKVGDRTAIPMSITSGVGLVSQMNKFGRIIAGNSYSNYLLLKKHDFAYNKSATKENPEGFIAMYSGDELAAVPNSIFTCFRIAGDSPVPQYLNYLFLGNLHGRWLQKFIEVGARAHGSLSINEDDLLALPVPVPSGRTSLAEQQKIAECLGSVDDVIAAQARKVDALKTHKKWLMQQLFPREGETQPRLRFSEFGSVAAWAEKRLSSEVHLISGLHLSPNQYSTTGEVPYFTGPSDFTNDVENVCKWTKRSANVAAPNDTLITVKGSGVGEVWFSTLPAVALGRQLMAIRAKRGSSQFIFQFLLTKRRRFADLGSGNLIPGLSRTDILDMEVSFPSPAEQQRIGTCLGVVDALITAEARGLGALKRHKRGLMQRLFPTSAEVEA